MSGQTIGQMRAAGLPTPRIADRHAFQRIDRPLANAPLRLVELSARRLEMLRRVAATGPGNRIWFGSMTTAELRIADWLLLRGLVRWHAGHCWVTTRARALLSKGEVA